MKQSLYQKNYPDSSLQLYTLWYTSFNRSNIAKKCKRKKSLQIGHSKIELQVGQEFCFLNALYRNFAWSSRASKCFKYIISLNFLHVKSDCIDNSTNTHKYHWKYHARNLRSKHLTKTWFPFRFNKFFRHAHSQHARHQYAHSQQ